jgi:hypothetical protein
MSAGVLQHALQEAQVLHDLHRDDHQQHPHHPDKFDMDLDHELHFWPPLPQWKVDALNQVQTGNQIKVYLQFPFAFWDRTVDHLLFSSELRHNLFMVWQTMSPTDGRAEFFPSTTAVLVGTLTGEQADRIETQHDTQVLEQAVASVRHMFTDRTVPWPVATHITRWRTNPAFRGTVPRLVVGANASVFELLEAPVNSVIFAGDSCDDEYQGQVLGAYYSGQRAAQYIINQMRPPGSTHDVLIHNLETLIVALLVFGAGVLVLSKLQDKFSISEGSKSMSQIFGFGSPTNVSKQREIQQDFARDYSPVEHSPERSPRESNSMELDSFRVALDDGHSNAAEHQSDDELAASWSKLKKDNQGSNSSNFRLEDDDEADILQLAIRK